MGRATAAGCRVATLLWFFCAVASIFWIALPASAQEGDAEHGRSIFNRCGACHSIKDQTRRIGPTLNGVVGRTAGTVPEFHYSAAMREAGAGGLVWNETNLAEYIADPKRKVPGNAMAFPGLPEPQDVADVIAYIRTFSTSAN